MSMLREHEQVDYVVDQCLTSTLLMIVKFVRKCQALVAMAAIHICLLADLGSAIKNSFLFLHMCLPAF